MVNQGKCHMIMVMVCTFRTDFRQHIISLLSQRGYTVCTPNHRQDVLPMAIQQQPLVVLLDMYVIHPSGIELLHDLRTHGFEGKVILLGGKSVRFQVSQAAHLGVTQVVEGPPIGVSYMNKIGHIEAVIHSALHSTIAERAYALYESRGRTHGHDEEDWVQAERLLFKQELLPNPDSKPSRISQEVKLPKKSQLHLSILEDAKEVMK